MALYPYECAACGPFEGWHPISQALEDAPPTWWPSPRVT
jgi:hypothetical protein